MDTLLQEPEIAENVNNFATREGSRPLGIFLCYSYLLTNKNRPAVGLGRANLGKRKTLGMWCDRVGWIVPFTSNGAGVGAIF